MCVLCSSWESSTIWWRHKGQLIKNEDNFFSTPSELSLQNNQELQRLKINKCRKYYQLYYRNIMTYKIMKKLCPENLFHEYSPRSTISSHNTRNRRIFEISKYRLEYLKKAFTMQPWTHGMKYLLQYAIKENRKTVKNAFKELDSNQQHLLL